MTKKYEEYTREELLAEIRQLKQKKKYGLVWEDKPEDVVEQCKQNFPVLTEVADRAIKATSNSPSKGELFPSSGGGEATHLIIDGDNYHALSVLNVTHKGKIDVIYIDPPYNTGNKDFKYNDDYVDREDSFRHSKWLSFMEKRLRLARELLNDSGVIFISIDDNEQAHLKILCDEVFGEENFIADFIRRNKAGAGHDSGQIAIEFDYMLCYAKHKPIANLSKEKIDIENDTKYKLTDDFVDYRGKYYLRDLDYKGSYSQTLDYSITTPDGTEIYSGGKYGKPNTWRWSESKVKWGIENDFIVFKKTGNNWKVYIKQYQFVDNENNKRERFIPYRALIQFLNSEGSQELSKLLKQNIFTYPKPLSLIKFCASLIPSKSATILDFFAGSGTTGHAVLELNKDGGNRQFILCTNNENGICEEVTYPRIKKVIEGYGDKKGIPANVRYFRTDFVARSEDTDENRVKITQRCYEMLQIKEGCYEAVASNVPTMKIYGSSKKLLCVIFDRYNETRDSVYIDAIRRTVETLYAPSHQYEIVIYRFSIDSNLDMDVSAIPNARLEEIPEEILKTFHQIFKQKKKRK